MENNCLFFFVFYFLAYLCYWGFRPVFGIRDEDPPIPTWPERAIKTHDNMVASLAHYGIIVIVAHLLGVTNIVTDWAMVIFFIGRILHAIIYLINIPWIRCIPYMIALGAEIVILVQILLHYF